MIKQGKLNGFEHNFLIQARKINSSMPNFTMDIIQDELNNLGAGGEGGKNNSFGAVLQTWSF